MEVKIYCFGWVIQDVASLPQQWSPPIVILTQDSYFLQGRGNINTNPSTKLHITERRVGKAKNKTSLLSAGLFAPFTVLCILLLSTVENYIFVC